jgi:hypothetical protein
MIKITIKDIGPPEFKIVGKGDSDIELTGEEYQDSGTPVPHHDQEHWEGYSDDSHNN